MMKRPVSLFSEIRIMPATIFNTDSEFNRWKLFTNPREELRRYNIELKRNSKRFIRISWQR